MSRLQETEKKMHTMYANFMSYMEKHRLYELFYVNNLYFINIILNFILFHIKKRNIYRKWQLNY